VISGKIRWLYSNNNKLCAWRHGMPRPSPPFVGTPALVFLGLYYVVNYVVKLLQSS